MAPKAIPQPGGPDMIQVPRFDPETGEVQPPAAPVAAAPAAPVPSVAPPVAPAAPPPAYAQYPPPAYQPPLAYAPPVAQKRKGLPWWGWLIIGGATLFVVVVAVGVLTVFSQLNKGHSPDYTGAPVTPTEQGQTTQLNGITVVSDSGAVAYVVPDEWVNAGDYMDLSAMEAPLQDGQDIVGTYFTGDPSTVTPQLVVVLESSPGPSNWGTFDNQMDEYLKGFAASAGSISEATRVPVTTANGLEGLQGDFSASYDAGDALVRATILGNGNRLVFVQWISYEGPIDEAAYTALLDTVRVDN
ncbi:MAG: hypothetical protein NVV57_06780 [Demequina sp.]|nr:hypothetical protein [Demequina sp.]